MTGVDFNTVKKTCWYLCLGRLRYDWEYNDAIAREWFAVNTLSKIRLAEATAVSDGQDVAAAHILFQRDVKRTATYPSGLRTKSNGNA